MANTPNINLVKPLGTDKALVSVINDNSDKIDAFAGSVNTNMANTQDGFAIVVNGNNAPKAITAGQYLFIKNHSTLSAGGYHATANIANGAAITSSNVAADADGVVNGAFSALNGNIGNIGKTTGIGKTLIGNSGESNSYLFDFSAYADGVYLLTNNNRAVSAIISKRNSTYGVIAGDATISGSTVTYATNSWFSSVYMTKLVD